MPWPNRDRFVNRRVEFLFAARPEAVATWLADQQVDGLCQARDSAEVARYKERVDFRHTYRAVEVGRPVRQAVEPTIAPPRAVSPSGGGRRVIAPQGMRSIDINPRARKLERYNAGVF